MDFVQMDFVQMDFEKKSPKMWPNFNSYLVVLKSNQKSWVTSVILK
jgi:hypothetical protein